jgi:hypothetical protein
MNASSTTRIRPGLASAASTAAGCSTRGRVGRIAHHHQVGVLGTSAGSRRNPDSRLQQYPLTAVPGREQRRLRLGELRVHHHGAARPQRPGQQHEGLGRAGGEQHLFGRAAVRGGDRRGGRRGVGVRGEPRQRRRDPVEQPARRTRDPDVDREIHQPLTGFAVAVVAQVGCSGHAVIIAAHGRVNQSGRHSLRSRDEHDEHRRPKSRSRAAASAAALSAGLLAGYAADGLLADPSRGHPVALFGRAARRLENSCYADSRARGALYTAVCVGGSAALGHAVDRAVGPRRGLALAAVTATATWTVIGAKSLRREAEVIGELLEAGRPARRPRAAAPAVRAGPARPVRVGARPRGDRVGGGEHLGRRGGAAVLGRGRRARPGCWRTAPQHAGRDGRVPLAPVPRFGWASARLDDVANWRRPG